MFLGRSLNTDSNFIGLNDGSVIMARAMVRVVPKIRWDRARLQRGSDIPVALARANTEDVEELIGPHRSPSDHRDDGRDEAGEPDRIQKRVPMLIASAPSASAAIRLRPSAIPPLAMIGVSGSASTVAGNSTTRPTSSSSRRWRGA